MSDDELPVKVHSILALTQMIIVHESSTRFYLVLHRLLTSRHPVRSTVAPQIGKLVQGNKCYTPPRVAYTYVRLDLLKLCDETELESLNSSLKAIVAYYHEELLPVAVELTIRLVRDSSMFDRIITHLEDVVRHLLAFSC
jgi:hypothetical protein